MAFPTISATHTDIWLEFWNTTFKDYIEGLATDAGGWPSLLTANGRLVVSDSDEWKPVLTGSPSLAIVIPDGAQYVIDGKLFTADGDQSLVGLTPNVTRYLEITVDEEGVWDYIEHESRPAAGTGVAAKVTTGASSVTDLDTSEAETDVILTMPVLMARLNSFDARLTLLEGGGGGGGGSTYSGSAPWLSSDPRATAAVIDEKIATAIAGIGGADAIRENPELRSLIAELGSQGIGIAEINPDVTTRSESTTIVIGITGDGSGGTIDDLEEGTATVDEEAQVIGP